VKLAYAEEPQDPFEPWRELELALVPEEPAQPFTFDATIRFASARSAIDRDSVSVLEQLATSLAEHPEAMVVRIEGHTDDRGPAAVNTRISRGRAEAVREVLVRLGVAPDRLVAVGLGSARPISTNRTPLARMLNRRVEIHVGDPANVQTASR
jgi:outer membrane protein OmpA-like peptidoglycan-associated protein